MSKKGNPPGFYSYEESFTAIQRLTDEEAGRLYKAKYCYWINNQEPDFSDNERLETVWIFEKARLDTDRYSYYLNSVKNSYNVYKRDNKENPLAIDSWFTWKKAVYESEGVHCRAFEIVDIADLMKL